MACVEEAMKKYPAPRHHLARAWKAVKGFCKKPQRPATAFEEMQRGSAVGMPAAALIAAGMGLPDGIILGAGLFGICAGALIGLLLWIGADDMHDDPVIPPGRNRKGQSDIRRGPPRS